MIAPSARMMLPYQAAVQKKRFWMIADTEAFQCPVPGCQKVFAKTRSGWDSHVASRRNHPLWRPELESIEERKKQFMSEFPHFFR
jgi:hypothetical protein